MSGKKFSIKRTISSMKELMELEEEIRKNVQESSKAEYSYYKSIIDLMKQRYEAEKNYLDDLIAKKKELLDAEQDLHQYAKDIKKQTDSIASLQKQLAESAPTRVENKNSTHIESVTSCTYE